MKKVGIVTDSHSGMTQAEAKERGVWVLPMPFFFGQECFHEDIGITREEFFDRIEAGEKVSTTQPSPEEVMEVWDRALSECEQIIYIPISSGLSGSCDTASLLAGEEKYEGKVFVADLGRISVPLVCTIYDALKMIEKGMDAKQVYDEICEHKDDFDIYVGVDDISYLQRGGRISATAAFIGKMLNIKPMLHLHSGLLEKDRECRGNVKLHKEMISAIKEEMESKYSDEIGARRVQVIAAACDRREKADAWKAKVQEAFPEFEVIYGDLSLGIACHLGPGGIGVGFSVSPLSAM